jgi:hypothetical protein
VNACVLEAIQLADPPKSGSEPWTEEKAALSTGKGLNYVHVQNAMTHQEILEVEVLQECVARHVTTNVEDRHFYRDTNCAPDTPVDSTAPHKCQDADNGDKYAGGNRVVYLNGTYLCFQYPSTRTLTHPSAHTQLNVHAHQVCFRACFRFCTGTCSGASRTHWRRGERGTTVQEWAWTWGWNPLMG